MKLTPRLYAQRFVLAVLREPARSEEMAEALWRRVLADKHFGWRQRIVQEVADVWHQQSGQRRVEVATARDLEPGERSAIMAQLAAALGERLSYDWVTKPHLVGGAVVTVDGERFDCSVKGRLDSLYHALTR